MNNGERMTDGVEGRLGEAVEQVRGERIPGGPSAELVGRTIERMKEMHGGVSGRVGMEEGFSFEKRSWRMKMVRRFSAAAAVGIVATGGVLWMVWGHGARMALADVLEQVKQANAVRCHVEAVLPTAMGQGGNAATANKQASEVILMVDPGWMVVESVSMQGMAGGGEVKMVINTVQGKMLMLVGVGGVKQAIEMDLKNLPPEKQTPDILQMFKKANAKGAKALGEKEIGGVKAKGFDVVTGEQEMEVWADEKTEKPVLAVMTMKNAMVGEMRYTFSDFDWSPVYEASELSFAVPAGYEVVKSTANVSTPVEADVTTMLTMMTEMNGGTLPEGVGMKDFKGVLMKWSSAQGAAIKPGAMPPGMMEKAMTVGRGWAYMAATANGSEWMYGGKDVKAGESGKIVLWYRPAGGKGWRGFAADGTVREVTEGELPKGGEKVMLGLPTTGGSGTQPAGEGK